MFNPTDSSQDVNNMYLPLTSNSASEPVPGFAAPGMGSMDQASEAMLSSYSSPTNLASMIDHLSIQPPHLSAQASQAGTVSTEYSVEPAQGFGQMLNQQPVINQGEPQHQFSWTSSSSLMPMFYPSVPTQVVPALPFHGTVLPADTAQPEKQNQLALYNSHENQSNNSLLQIPIYPPQGNHSQLVFANYQEQQQPVHYRQPQDTEPDPEHCSVCNTNSSPTWRRHKRTGARVCNACGLYYALYQKNREFIINSQGNRVVKRQKRGTGNRRTTQAKKRTEAMLQFVPNSGYYGIGNMPRMDSFNSSSQSTTYSDEL
ncbi:hypothetical protein IWW40_001955 [Coemansia sp. RSA 1250]|nr:hypothetical protein IWW40_001955 [Coemansia sp. RSA 1250]